MRGQVFDFNNPGIVREITPHQRSRPREIELQNVHLARSLEQQTGDIGLIEEPPRLTGKGQYANVAENQLVIQKGYKKGAGYFFNGSQCHFLVTEKGIGYFSYLRNVESLGSASKNDVHGASFVEQPPANARSRFGGQKR